MWKLHFTLERKPLQSEGTVINMNKLKTILGISAIAGAIAAVIAYKRKKDLEEYEYEEFDECFCDDCCYPDEESAEEAINQASEDKTEDSAEDASEDTTDSTAEETDESTAPEAEIDQAEE